LTPFRISAKDVYMSVCVFENNNILHSTLDKQRGIALDNMHHTCISFFSEWSKLILTHKLYSIHNSIARS
jgi:hypothetical protein